MTRRHFLLASAAATSLGAATLHAATSGVVSATPDDLIRELIRANDEQVPRVLQRQERGIAHPARGGVPNEYGMFTAHDAAGFISHLVASHAAPGSKYYHAAELVEPLQHAVRFLLKMQHDDGTIDLYSTNFHSTPDMGFVLEVIGAAATILKLDPWPQHEALQAALRTFILKGADALTTGGIHTPNHRWVVCAGLAWAHSLYPNPKYVRRIDQWLDETIDVDPDGQFTEKSTTVYSPIVDRALITVARLLDRPALFEPVRRNLEMTLYYVHPDGEVVTEASTRQDKYQRGSMGRYYYAYRYLALRDGNGRFAAMARQIEETARGKLAGELPAFLADPSLRRPLPANAALPTNYEKVFAYSGLVRIRREQASGTILAGNATLLSFRKGAAALEALRLASAFFGKGQFVGEKLEQQNGAYVLRQSLEGPYFQPLSRDQIAGGEHVKMAPNGTLATNSRAVRARSNIQKLESIATITERNGAFEVRFDISGTDHVPVAIELAFRHGGQLHGVEPIPNINDAYLLKAGMGRYAFGGQTIEFGPGKTEHAWTQLRGALPKWDGQSVYVTGFTPFRMTLKIA
jgi:hypothetical protein